LPLRVLIVLFGVGIRMMGGSFGGFAKASAWFPHRLLAYMLGNQAISKQYGFGAEAGACCSHGHRQHRGHAQMGAARLPGGVLHQKRPGAVGAEVLFNKIMAIGIPGIFVAWWSRPSCW
jgi:hypothetical protein